jgi:hypothetical protein
MAIQQACNTAIFDVDDCGFRQFVVPWLEERAYGGLLPASAPTATCGQETSPFHVRPPGCSGLGYQAWRGFKDTALGAVLTRLSPAPSGTADANPFPRVTSGAPRRGAEKTGRAGTKGAATLHRESRDLGGPHVAFGAIVGTDGGTGPGAASCDLHTRC